jgi:hypothetical protein
VCKLSSAVFHIANDRNDIFRLLLIKFIQTAPFIFIVLVAKAVEG